MIDKYKRNLNKTYIIQYINIITTLNLQYKIVYKSLNCCHLFYPKNENIFNILLYRYVIFGHITVMYC